MKQLISIAIITWNRSTEVLRAIESVYKQSYRPIEIVVADSASTNDTIEKIKKQYPEVKIIQLHRNLGCPEGRNIAFANCSGEIIFSLDDDGWIAPETLKCCFEKFKQDITLGVVACNVIEPKNDSIKSKKDFYCNCFQGGAFAIRRKLFNEIGYFPSDYFRQGEETDLSLRIIDRGYSIIFCKNAIMYHEKSVVNRNDKLFMFYSTRNDLYTIIKRYPLYLMPFAILWKIIIWNLAGIRKNSLHFTFLGSISALLLFPKIIYKREPVSLNTIKKFVFSRRKILLNFIDRIKKYKNIFTNKKNR